MGAYSLDRYGGGGIRFDSLRAYRYILTELNTSPLSLNSSFPYIFVSPLSTSFITFSFEITLLFPVLIFGTFLFYFSHGVAQLVEGLRYKSEGLGFESR
jgi:hypothetical protein